MTNPQRRVGVMLPRDLPIGQVLPFARRAEELGFDEVWVVEDLGFRGGIAQAGAILAATQRITVGVGIVPAAARLAAFAAMEFATLGQLFPGRVIAGIGHGMAGWIRSLDAWPASPLTLLSETTTAVRNILRGLEVPQGGRYVSVKDVEFTELPRGRSAGGAWRAWPQIDRACRAALRRRAAGRTRSALLHSGRTRSGRRGGTIRGHHL